MKNMNIAPIAYDANGVEIYARANGELHYHRPDLHVEALSKITLPEDRGFVLTTIDMGYVIGIDHLVETTKDDIIVYLRRGNRAGETRMVLNREGNPTTFVTAVLCKGQAGDPDTIPGTEGKWVLATLFEGLPAEKEPWDRAFENADIDEAAAEAKRGCEEKWAKCALVPAEKELEDIKNGKGIFVHPLLQMINKQGYIREVLDGFQALYGTTVYYSTWPEDEEYEVCNCIEMEADNRFSSAARIIESEGGTVWGWTSPSNEIITSPGLYTWHEEPEWGEEDVDNYWE